MREKRTIVEAEIRLERFPTLEVVDPELQLFPAPRGELTVYKVDSWCVGHSRTGLMVSLHRPCPLTVNKAGWPAVARWYEDKDDARRQSHAI